MQTFVQPIIIQGPAYVGHGGVIYYVKDDIMVEDTTKSWNPATTFGDAGERHLSRIFKITTTPVGMLTSALLNYFYEAHLAPQTYVGRSIFPVSNTALTIYSITENQTYGFVWASVPTPPDLYAGPGQTAFGSMSHTAIGNPSVAPTNANFVKATSGSIGSADTSFDAGKIRSDIYQGVLGSVGSPYNSLGGMDGFLIKFGYKTKEIEARDIGIGDIILDAAGFGISAHFSPSNLTEAQVDTLLGLQGTGAVLPGQPYGGSATSGNLVLTGITYGWAFTAVAVGAKSAKRQYKIGEHRFPKGAVEMVNQLTNTAGVPNALFAFTAGT